ncbi:MAG: hypothetical protein AB1705_20560 [Verrucomicrobiota bacterium]
MRLTYLFFAMAVIVSGCGGGDKGTPPSSQAPAQQSGGPALGAAPADAPPPPAPPPVAGDGGAVAVPSVAAPVAVDPADPSGGDPLIHFRFEPNGARRDDLTALQAAVDGYSRLIGSSVMQEGDKPWDPLTADMSGLIQRRLIKGFPAAPDGKRYVYNPETRKVSLK